MTLINRQLNLQKRPQGLIKDGDLVLVESDVRSLQDGEFLIKTQYLSLAPVMKFYMLDGAGIEDPLPIGSTIRGRGVGVVIDSKHKLYKPGDTVQGKFGWQEYVISKGEKYDMMYHVHTDGLSPSTALGVLGITGYTSYFGLYSIGNLKAGDQVLVSAAAGGVGCALGQLASIKGASAVGLTSTDEKCRVLVEKLGYRAAINYKTEHVSSRIEELFPNGIDVYFDNVGGEILDTALDHLNKYARVVMCGRISTYTDSLDEQSYHLKNWHKLGVARGSMTAFFIYDFEPHFEEARDQMIEWIKSGKLTYHEDILDGLESMPEALNRLYQGKNIGKQLVKI